MVEHSRQCPDCGVDMDELAVDASGHPLRVVSETNKAGLPGSLGAKQTYGTTAVVCPECGLIRLYADLDG